MVETKRNKAAILALRYSFGVALPMRLRIRIPRLNPATCVRRRLSIFSCLRKCVRRMPPGGCAKGRSSNSPRRRINRLPRGECDVGSRRWRLARPVCPSICGHLALAPKCSSGILVRPAQPGCRCRIRPLRDPRLMYSFTNSALFASSCRFDCAFSSVSGRLFVSPFAPP